MFFHNNLVKCLWIMGVGMILVGCAQQEGGAVNEKAIAEYGQLLLGNRDLVGQDLGPMDRKEIAEKMESWDDIRYALCDIDGDSVEELHVRAGTHYYIVVYREDELRLLYEGVYEIPIKGNDLCGIFYHRPGGAPTHDRYGYKQIDQDGTITGELWFEWYDDNENGKRDDGDSYLYEERETDRTEWEEKTIRFFTVDEAAIEWLEAPKSVWDE